MESREMQVKGVNAHLSRPGNLVCAGHTVTSVKAPPCTKKKKHRGMATIYENAQQKNGKINEEKCAELKSEKRANKIN